MSFSVKNTRVLHETEKALKVFFEDDAAEHWIPKSQVDDDSEVWKKDDDGTLVVSDWFAEKEGWL